MLDEVQENGEQLRSLAEDKAGTFSQEDDVAPPRADYTEQLLTFAAAAGAAVLARHLLRAGWRTTLHREPPKNPASSSVDWQDALLWGAVSGALVGVTRIVSRRASTAAYKRMRA